MICLPPSNPATRRYMLRSGIAATVYIGATYVDVWIFTRHHVSGLPAYALALLSAVPILGMIAAVFLYLAEEKDEFQRNLFVQAMVWAIGATLAVLAVLGALENFAGTTHLQLLWIYPMYWVFFGVAGAVLSLRYR